MSIGERTGAARRDRTFDEEIQGEIERNQTRIGDLAEELEYLLARNRALQNPKTLALMRSRWKPETQRREERALRDWIRPARPPRKHGEWQDEPLESRYKKILRADPCSYCGSVTTQIDHIVAASTSGPDEWDNYTSACARCNRSKAAKSLLAFLHR